MIRGTNKRIIEISGEEGSCFERIVLFLRPEQESEKDEGRMLKMAEDYADGLFHSQAGVSILRRRRRIKWKHLSSKRALMGAVLALAAAGVVVLCLMLL